jgi:hypothetical protein
MKRHLLLLTFQSLAPLTQGKDRPNILFAISDDQSFPHAGAYAVTG